MMPFLKCFKSYKTLSLRPFRPLHFPSRQFSSKQSEKNNYSVPLTVFIHEAIRKEFNISHSYRKLKILLPHISPDGVVSSLSEKEVKGYVESRVEALSGARYQMLYHEPGSSRLVRHLSGDELSSAIVNAQNKRGALHLLVEPSFSLSTSSDPSNSSSSDFSDACDPARAEHYSLLSFYRFMPVASPEDTVRELRELWTPLRALGRVYVAPEGVNAQMCVPSNALARFREVCDGHWLLSGVRLNLDHQVSRGDVETNPPFAALHIRVKKQVLTDGLDVPLKLHGPNLDVDEMEPHQWHKALLSLNAKSVNSSTVDSNNSPIVVDCRNLYESEVGTFAGSVPLGTELFTESWTALDELLQGQEKDREILTYCTGGIRCVKVNQWLRERRGFTNVKRLKGGIINYVRYMETNKDVETSTVENASASISPNEIPVLKVGQSLRSTSESSPLANSMFLGSNYVFDERMVSPASVSISSAFSSCHCCGNTTTFIRNCKAQNCHLKYIQCDSCFDTYHGCCSIYCRDIGMTKNREKGEERESRSNRHMISRKKNMNKMKIVNNVEKISLADSTPNNTSKITLESRWKAIELYSERMSSVEPEYLAQVREATEEEFKGLPGTLRMICSVSQGRFLALLAQMTNAKSVLEIGTFTGYGALCLAEGVSNNIMTKDLLTSEKPILTCEVDERTYNLSLKSISSSPHASLIDSRNMAAEELLNQLKNEKRKFDLVFLDADKKKYKDYLETLLENDLLNEGGIVVADNTLWKGLVLHMEDDLSEFAEDYEDYGKRARMERVSKCMHDFNSFVASHKQLQVSLLPIRDGLTIIRKKTGDSL